MNDDTTQEIPFGYCECGCGQPTKLAPYSSKRIGWVKNQPMRFINGHNAKLSLNELFWRSVDKRAPDQCWLWTGYINDSGYGEFRYDYKLYRAHRVSYELHNGPIEDGLFVCHSCDVRNCINPAHLWLGTCADNMQDCVNKGRLHPAKAFGESHPNHKLTESMVTEVRQMARDGISVPEITRLFGVSDSTIRSVISRNTWPHVP